MMTENSTANMASLLRKVLTVKQLIDLQEVLNEDGDGLHDLLSEIAYRVDPQAFTDHYVPYTKEEWEELGKSGKVPDECLGCGSPRDDHTKVLALCNFEFALVDEIEAQAIEPGEPVPLVNGDYGFVPTDDGNCALCGLVLDHHIGETKDCPPGLGRYRRGQGTDICNMCHCREAAHEGASKLCPIPSAGAWWLSSELRTN
jgi:hypothetical protein